MKRTTLLATAFAVLFCLSGFPLLAQGRGAGGGGMGGAGMGQGTGQGMGQDRGMGGAMGRGPGIDTGIERGSNNGTNGPSMSSRKTPEQLLTQNTKLSSRLQSLLPAGTDVQSAASGFKNLGQFIAAVHVSHNLGIPFDQLKTKMTSGDSLGKAIETLHPNISHKQVKADVKEAKSQAKKDIKESRL
jgi:hypothetical protein